MSEKRTEIGQARECSISPDRKRAHLGVVLVIKLGPQTSVFHGARSHLSLLVSDQPFPILLCNKDYDDNDNDDNDDNDNDDNNNDDNDDNVNDDNNNDDNYNNDNDNDDNDNDDNDNNDNVNDDNDNSDNVNDDNDNDNDDVPHKLMMKIMPYYSEIMELIKKSWGQW